MNIYIRHSICYKWTLYTRKK